MNLEDIEPVRDCLENTDNKGKEDIRRLDKEITPKVARTILKGYAHLTTLALVKFLEEKSKEKTNVWV